MRIKKDGGQLGDNICGYVSIIAWNANKEGILVAVSSNVEI